MRKMTVWLAAFVALGFIAAFARADEEKIDVDKLPEKVVAAVKAKYPDAKLEKASKERENDKTLYEVGIKNGEQKIDVTLEEDGTIVEIEKTIDAKDLPQAVTDALETKYPKYSCKKAEEISKKDKLEYYEVVLETAEKKKFEVVVKPDGKIVKEESKDKKKDK
jgi:hypothetical protein